MEELYINDMRLISVLYSKGCFESNKRITSCFDCYVVNRKKELTSSEIQRFASDLLHSSIALYPDTVPWIEVFGFFAEEIHDAIDLASVNIGRQATIGDGNPMTSWDKDMITDCDIATYILSGGQGICDLKLLLVIGEAQDESELYKKIVMLQSEEIR